MEFLPLDSESYPAVASRHASEGNEMCHNETRNYTYSPLPSNENFIRVLTILPTLTQNGDLLRVTIETTRLEAELSFDALSYTWGDDSKKVNIDCDGESIDVTQNCLDGLWHLKEIYGSLRIWVDAICINQNNKEEKNGQLPLMGTIYSQANRVFIWLGPGNNKTDAAMEYLRVGCLPFARSLCSHVGRSQVPTGNRMSISLALHWCSRLFTLRQKPHFEGLQDILDRCWIKRLWTLQEVLLAKDAVIVCGTTTLPWFSMVLAMQYIQMNSPKSEIRLTLKAPRFYGPYLSLWDDSTLIFPIEFLNWRRLTLLWCHVRRLSQLPPSSGLDMSINEGCNAIHEVLQNHDVYFRRGQLLYAFLLKILMIFSALFFILGKSLVVVAHRSVDLESSESPICNTTPSDIATSNLLEQRLLDQLKAWLICGSKLRKEIYLKAFFVVAGMLIFLRILALLAQSASNRARRSGFAQSPRYHENEAILMELVVRRCKEPKDRYAAIHGIIRGPQVPDGRKSAPDLDWDLSVAILCYTKSLTFLLLASPCTRDTAFADYPSWVIDWSNAPQSWIKVSSSYSPGKGIMKFSGATPGSTGIAKLIENNKVIVVKGHLKAHVTHIFTELTLEAFEGTFKIREIGHITEAMDGIWQLFLTLVEPVMMEQEIAFSRVESRHLVNKHGKIVTKEPGLNLWKVMLACFKKEKLKLAHYAGSISGFGLVLSGAMVGDLVTLVAGFPMPLLLRRQHERFTIAGPSFFPEIMSGRCWKREDAGSLQDLFIV
ncbi:heterokaryon incompatibility protein-domain-containing protein [Xylaria scruposa]|nr:heterokaryon incompatibility protein-domain-containing protein [Xylaria scruposa]